MLCDILLANVLGCDRSALLLSLDRKMETEDARRMAEAVSELSLGVPVQYIVGSCWFYNREIKVGRGCFIPRGDTEFLAAAAVAALPEGGSFADLCSGAGASLPLSRRRSSRIRATRSNCPARRCPMRRKI